MRLIDADELWEKLYRYTDNEGAKMTYGDDDSLIHKDSACFLIENAPTIKPEPQWIPCSERLPEEQGFYLVTVCAEYRPVRIYCFSPYGMYEDKKYWINDCDCHSYVFNHFVEAWMPLPKPWEGVSE